MRRSSSHARRADSRAASLDGTGCACYVRFNLPFRTPVVRPISTLPLLLAVLLLAATIAGCVGAPVQEMSNARQAVRAAERAGAASHAPDTLNEARRLLKNAEYNLRHGDYRTARDDAEQARNKAVEARRVAELAAVPVPP